MSRALNRLSALAVAKLKEPGRYADGGGLYVQVSASGGKSWLLRFMLNGKAREMGLGSVSSVSLADARKRAAEAREALSAGIDPLERRKEDRAQARAAEARSATFAEVAELYIQSHESGWKNPKKLGGLWRGTLKRYAFPVFGELPVGEVDLPLVLKALEPIWRVKPETASRVRNRVEAILDYAKVRGLREGENPARWKGTLDVVLPSPTAVRAVRHYAALPYPEIGDFMAALRDREATAARALEFTILTASRTNEVLQARWGEIDLDAALWVVPAERMKMKREHRVPLSRQAVAILKDMAGQGDYLFPGPKPDKPLSQMSMAMLLRRMGRDEITVHGFRSTFRDWVSETTAFPGAVAEAALAHAVGDAVEAAYRRGDLFNKRVKLMQSWADFLDKPSVKNSAVTPLRRKAE